MSEEISSKVEQVNGYFSREEIEHLYAAIDELSKKLDELHQKNELTQDELNTIKQILKTYKEEAKEMPKKTWYRAMGGHMTSIAVKFLSSKSGQDLIKEGAIKLLGK